MKLHQISLAILSLAAGAAQAALPTPLFIVNLDGATAVGKSVVDVSKAMCKNAASTQAFQAFGNSKITGVYCSDVDTANSGLPAGTKLWISKNNVDGSLETFQRAINQVAPTAVLDPATCTLPSPLNSSVLNCGTTNGSGTITVKANGGFSDVEDTIWKARGVFVPAIVPESSPLPVRYATISGFAGQGFGVAVTDKLYAALQARQGIVAVPGVYDVATQPNITKQQYTSILNQAGAYHTDWTPLLGAAALGATNNMNLCRRTNFSGTQAGMEVYFLNNPCSNANPTFGLLNAALGSDSSLPTDPLPHFNVIENAGTGDVKTCLNAHNQDLVNAAVKADGTAADEYAIGIMSLENTPVVGTDHWHFVKLDGISPTPDASQRQTVIDGQYNYAFESQFAYRTTPFTASAGGSTNDKPHIDFMAKFVALLGDPSKVNPLNGIFSVPSALASYTGFPTRVHRGTTGGNACSPFSLTE